MIAGSEIKYMKLPLIITALFFLFLPVTVFAGTDLSTDTEEEVGLRYTVSGYVKDVSSGEGLIGAAIIIEELNKGTVTNVYGFYSLSLPAGLYHMKISYLGYQYQDKIISLNQNLVINIELDENIQELEEVTISAEGPQSHIRKAEMSVNKLQIKAIKRIPTLMGEVDVIKAIQLLPGV